MGSTCSHCCKASTKTGSSETSRGRRNRVRDVGRVAHQPSPLPGDRRRCTAADRPGGVCVFTLYALLVVFVGFRFCFCFFFFWLCFCYIFVFVSFCLFFFPLYIIPLGIYNIFILMKAFTYTFFISLGCTVLMHIV